MYITEIIQFKSRTPMVSEYIINNLNCSECGFENSVQLKGNKFSPKCLNCGKRLFSSERIEGYVYVLSNASMPGLVKIGFTERDDIDQRVKELSSGSGVPKPFILEASFASTSPRDDEQRIHKEMVEYRLSSQREFFQVSLQESVQIISDLLKREPVFIHDEDLLLPAKEKTAKQDQTHSKSGTNTDINRLKRIAQEGDIVAQFHLGKAYHDGVGVKQDYEKAIFWWVRAAEKDHSDAQFHLGKAYHDGVGVKQDYEKSN